MYITTLSILRETWARCVKVRQILRNLLIKVDERDVFMSRENQTELMERMGTCGLQLPQVFVDGQYLGVKMLPIYFSFVRPLIPIPAAATLFYCYHTVSLSC